MLQLICFPNIFNGMLVKNFKMCHFAHLCYTCAVASFSSDFTVLCLVSASWIYKVLSSPLFSTGKGSVSLSDAKCLSLWSNSMSAGGWES